MESSAPDFAALSPNIAAVFGGVIPEILPIADPGGLPVGDVWEKFFSEHRGHSSFPGTVPGAVDSSNPFARPHPELPWVDRGLPARSAAPGVVAAADGLVIGEIRWEANVAPLPKAG